MPIGPDMTLAVVPHVRFTATHNVACSASGFVPVDIAREYQQRVWECEDLWDDELRFDGVLASDDDTSVVDVPDPPSWSGACRADGVRW